MLASQSSWFKLQSPAYSVRCCVKVSAPSIAVTASPSLAQLAGALYRLTTYIGFASIPIFSSNTRMSGLAVSKSCLFSIINSAKFCFTYIMTLGLFVQFSTGEYVWNAVCFLDICRSRSEPIQSF